MTGELEGDGDFIYEEGLCAPPCSICGYVDRRLTGEWCSHYIGIVIDNGLTEGPFADRFGALWDQAQTAVQSTDEVTYDHLELVSPKGLFQGLTEGSLHWLMDEFPHSVQLPDYAHPASSDGFVLYDVEPSRFESVLGQLGELIRATQSQEGSGDPNA